MFRYLSVDGERIGESESDNDVVGEDVREGEDYVVVIVVSIVIIYVTATVFQSSLSLLLMSTLASLSLSFILSLMD